MRTNALDWIALLLVIVGAVTWGALGITGLMGDPTNLVSTVLLSVFRPEAAQIVEYLVYVLVGLSGVYLLYTGYKMARASRRATRERRRREAAQDQTATDRTEP